MTENELLEELSKELAYPQIEPDEITSRMLATKLGISPRTAYEKLNKMVDEGRLTRRYVKRAMGRELAFRKVE